MLLSTSGAVTDTFTYWPYGEIVSHVGSSTTPFTFGGTIGYYMDVLGSQIYVRARYLRQALSRWQTRDPLWPRQLPYNYADAAPVVRADPTGLAVLVLAPLLLIPGVGEGVLVFGALCAAGAAGYALGNAISNAVAAPPRAVDNTFGGDEDYWDCVEKCTFRRLNTFDPPWVWGIVRVGCLNFCLGSLDIPARWFTNPHSRSACHFLR